MHEYHESTSYRFLVLVHMKQSVDIPSMEELIEIRIQTDIDRHILTQDLTDDMPRRVQQKQLQADVTFLESLLKRSPVDPQSQQ